MPTASDTASRLQRYIDAEAEILLNQRARFDNCELTMADLVVVQAQIRNLQAQLAREQAAATQIGRPRTFSSALSNLNHRGRARATWMMLQRGSGAQASCLAWVA